LRTRARPTLCLVQPVSLETPWSGGSQMPQGAVQPNMNRLEARRQSWTLRRILLAAAVAVAAFLLIRPVDADFINRTGSDTIEYRTAACGVPVAVVLGAGPDLPEGTTSSVGTVNASRACEATSGKWVAASLTMLLALAGVGSWAARSDIRSGR
jgi:hypothetical protein